MMEARGADGCGPQLWSDDLYPIRFHVCAVVSLVVREIGFRVHELKRSHFGTSNPFPFGRSTPVHGPRPTG